MEYWRSKDDSSHSDLHVKNMKVCFSSLPLKKFTLGDIKILFRLLFLLVLILYSILFGSAVVYSQEPQDIKSSPPFNFSDTNTASVWPFLLADETGVVHLFWSEDVGGEPVDPNDVLSNGGNTLMYAWWNGQSWSEPIDILLSPDGGPVFWPDAVIDNQGIIHIIWIGARNLFYSSVQAREATLSSAQVWQTPTKLAEHLTATEYSAAIAYEAPQTLHVIYASGEQGAELGSSRQRSLNYIKSTDGGASWSLPIELWSVSDRERGAGMVRLLVVEPGRVYASWSEYDSTGNSQAFYVARSIDSGQTWEPPFVLAERAPDDYEHDWGGIALLDEKRLVAIWEGGPRAFRQVRYSDDDGATWSPRVQILPDLVGENGFTEFGHDSTGRLHIFFGNRGAGGTARYGPDQIGLWHSAWNGHTWEEPGLIGGINPMVNPKIAIVGGNRFVATWYLEVDAETVIMTGEILDAAPIASAEAWPTAIPNVIPPTPLPSATPTTAVTPSRATPMSLPTQPAESPSNPGTPLIFGALSALAVIVITFGIQQYITTH